MPTIGRKHYNKLLAKHCDYCFTLLVVDTTLPIRFVSVSGSEFEALQLPCCDLFPSHSFKFESSDLHNILLPGQTVSMWSKRSESYSNYNFTVKDCELIQDVYGVGFGPRERTYSVGCNIYFGPRLSNVSSVEPFHSREDVYTGQYYRNYYNSMENAPFLESKVELVGRSVLDFARIINPHMNEVVGYYTCDRAILTLGTTYRSVKEIESNDVVTKSIKVNTLPSLGFANSPHVDSCDKIAPDQALKIMNELNAPKYIHHPIRSYCEKIHSTTGLALPTTCGYQLVGVVPSDFETVITFAVCGFAVNITHDVVHHFHGSAFPHFTPVPILVSKDKVRIHNKTCPNPFFVLAWGRSGGSRQARENREANLLHGGGVVIEANVQHGGALVHL